MEINTTATSGTTTANLFAGLLDPAEVERVESQVIDEHCQVAEQQEWYKQAQLNNTLERRVRI